jgi:hypothetical protein
VSCLYLKYTQLDSLFFFWIFYLRMFWKVFDVSDVGCILPVRSYQVTLPMISSKWYSLRKWSIRNRLLEIISSSAALISSQLTGERIFNWLENYLLRRHRLYVGTLMYCLDYVKWNKSLSIYSFLILIVAIIILFLVSLPVAFPNYLLFSSKFLPNPVCAHLNRFRCVTNAISNRLHVINSHYIATIWSKWSKCFRSKIILYF